VVLQVETEYYLDSMPENFQLGDMSKALNCSRQLLDKWANEHVLPPSVAASGPGTRRLYSKLDLFRAAVLIKVANFGFNKERLKQFQKKLSRSSERKLLESYVVLQQIDPRGGFGPDGRGNYRITMMQDPQKLRKLIEEYDSINIGPVAIMIRNAIARLPSLPVEIRESVEEACHRLRSLPEMEEG